MIYPTNKSFLNDFYLSILLLLFSHFFGASKGLIRDSQRLYFCNFVRTQENIRKRTAVEKEPLALDKDKKDQSKYYLSYSKPPVLDMKWENRDAIVVERAKIPKFIQLDASCTS